MYVALSNHSWSNWKLTVTALSPYDVLAETIIGESDCRPLTPKTIVMNKTNIFISIKTSYIIYIYSSQVWQVPLIGLWPQEQVPIHSSVSNLVSFNCPSSHTVCEQHKNIKL